MLCHISEKGFMELMKQVFFGTDKIY